MIDEIEQEFQELPLTEKNRYIQFTYSYCGEERVVLAKIDLDKKFWTILWLHENIERGNSRCSIMREPCVAIAWKYSQSIEKSYWEEQRRFIINLTN